MAAFVSVAPAIGCSSTAPGASPDAGDASASDASDASAPAPPVDPTLFDCTSLARPPLARRATATPAECLRDPTCTTRLVAGHRGAGGQLGRVAPEDSLSAYRAAVAMGLDLAETDPRPTKDGVLVNLHDTDVDRTTLGKGAVSEMTLAELRALPLRTGDLAGDFSCDRVPTLRELLETSVGRVMVLVDANKTDRVDLLVAAIQEAKALEWAVFDTSSTDKIDRALALEPRLLIMPRVASAAEATAVLAKYKAHPPPFVELDQSVFPAGVAEVHAGGSRAFTDVFPTDFGVKLGGDPKVYLEFYGKGADVLQTDLPDAVLTALGRFP
jgi:glycerophosphoryl diester phosphodiesterase